MYDAKNDDENINRGLSHIIGDRKYFGHEIDNLMHSGKGFYGNVHNNIFERFK